MQVASSLFPILRSPLVGELLAWLFLHPDESFSVRELASRFSVSESTVSREADRLVVATLFGEERRGNLRLLRANEDNPLARPLTELLALTYGPTAVLTRLLGGVQGVGEAYIYADEDDMFAVARAAEGELGREVNMHRVSAARWHEPGNDPFLASVRTRPLVALDIGGAEQ